MDESITFHSPEDVSAALSSPALVPPLPPPTLHPGSTAMLRSAMARFTNDEVHLARRHDVVALIATLDASTIRSHAARRTDARLQGLPVDAVAELAYTVPTEVLLDALAMSDDVDELTLDVGRIAAVIGRGAPSSEVSDDAVDRLSTRFAAHPAGRVAVLSMLYQNHDATAALLIETLDAMAKSRPRRAAVDRTVRLARRHTQILETDVAEGALVTLNLADAGHEFGFGPHQCPGRELAEAIVAGIQTAIVANGYAVSMDSIERGQNGRPLTLMLQVRS